jgi:hypothetical protein
MAFVSTKKKDGKYDHLAQIYNKPEESFTPKTSGSKVTAEQKIIKSNRPLSLVNSKMIRKDVIVLAGLSLAGVAGYLIIRFL